MPEYIDSGWECELCGARNEPGSYPCWKCHSDKVEALRIKREQELLSVPCDTHNSGLGWDCDLCDARNYGDTGARPCWQCQGDPEKARKIKEKAAERKAVW